MKKIKRVGKFIYQYTGRGTVAVACIRACSDPSALEYITKQLGNLVPAKGYSTLTYRNGSRRCKHYLALLYWHIPEIRLRELLKKR